MSSLDPEDPNVRMATFGRMVEDFLDGPIGTYLQSRAQEDELEAVKQLRLVDPEDTNSVRKYQNQALVAGKIIEWLADAVHQGQMSLEKLKEDYGD